MRLTGEKIIDRFKQEPSETATAVSSFVVAYANQQQKGGLEHNTSD
jgi:hypothetical protein